MRPSNRFIVSHFRRFDIKPYGQYMGVRRFYKQGSQDYQNPDKDPFTYKDDFEIQDMFYQDHKDELEDKESIKHKINKMDQTILWKFASIYYFFVKR